jgi:hypothetical protein
MRSTVAQALSPTSRICESLVLSPGDSRVLGYINQATMRLLHRGHWVDTMQRYAVQITQSLLTLPPVYAVAEQIAIERRPVDLRSPWFEWNPGSWGSCCEGDPYRPYSFADVALRRDPACTFVDIPSSTPSQLVIQCDVAADVGATVLILGYDANGNWIRTNPSGVWQDGVTVALSQTPGTTVTFNSTPVVFSKVTGIQKSVTNGQLWLYMVSTPSNVLLCNYQYWETNPWYARYHIPMVPSTTPWVSLYGKMAFRPVVNPTDWLLIGNLEAIRLACMAIRAEEQHDWETASLCMNGGASKTGPIDGAIPLLNYELQHVQGDGTIPEVRVSLGGMEPVPTLI